MKYFTGIDLHSDNSYIAVINEEGVLKLKEKCPNDINTILKKLEAFKSALSPRPASLCKARDENPGFLT